jgi:hypothetical protein
MPSIFRISQRGRVPGKHVDSLESAREHIRRQRPGCYDIDILHFEPDLSRHELKAWGRMFRHPDGQIEDELWAREE